MKYGSCCFGKLISNTISFLSFHQYSIFQVLSPKKINELLDSDNLYQSAKRFDINIDDFVFNESILQAINIDIETLCRLI
jgi:hypothetical protein